MAENTTGDYSLDGFLKEIKSAGSELDKSAKQDKEKGKESTPKSVKSGVSSAVKSNTVLTGDSAAKLLSGTKMSGLGGSLISASKSLSGAAKMDSAKWQQTSAAFYGKLAGHLNELPTSIATMLANSSKSQAKHTSTVVNAVRNGNDRMHGFFRLFGKKSDAERMYSKIQFGNSMAWMRGVVKSTRRYQELNLKSLGSLIGNNLLVARALRAVSAVRQVPSSIGNLLKSVVGGVAKFVGSFSLRGLVAGLATSLLPRMALLLGPAAIVAAIGGSMYALWGQWKNYENTDKGKQEIDALKDAIAKMKGEKSTNDTPLAQATRTGTALATVAAGFVENTVGKNSVSDYMRSKADENESNLNKGTHLTQDLDKSWEKATGTITPTPKAPPMPSPLAGAPAQPIASYSNEGRSRPPTSSVADKRLSPASIATVVQKSAEVVDTASRKPKNMLSMQQNASLENVPDTVKDRLFAMSEEYYGLTGKKLRLESAYRSSEKQNELYKAWKARKPGANPANPPGSSWHEHGLGFDTSSVQNDELDKNGLLSKYGFTRISNPEERHHLQPMEVGTSPSVRSKAQLESVTAKIPGAPSTPSPSYPSPSSSTPSYVNSDYMNREELSNRPSAMAPIGDPTLIPQLLAP